MASVLSPQRSNSTRMRGESRRNQIVAVAAELFASRGFSGTTTKEIAEGAGVSEAIIFRHFASKDKLYAAILDYKVKQGTERIKAQLEEAASRRDDSTFFGVLALEMLDFHTKDETFMRLLLFSALEGHELSSIFFDSTARDIRNHIRKYIKQRSADGAFRSIDPAVAARAFVGMVLHQVQARTIFKDDDLKLSNRQIADRFVEIFLKGVRNTEV